MFSCLFVCFFLGGGRDFGGEVVYLVIIALASHWKV